MSEQEIINESDAIFLLMKMIEAAKTYETTMREAYAKLLAIPQDERDKLYSTSASFRMLLDEFETTYNRIQKEI